MTLRKITALSLAGLFALAVSVGGVFAGHNPAVVEVDDADACSETTFTASVTDPEGTHLVGTMYLIVDVDGDVTMEPIPIDGTSASIAVGPFTSSQTVSWRVFGGGERDYDDPLWNGYGDPDFSSDIVAYADSEGGYGWTLAGTDDPNPFVTWNEVEVAGCDQEAPVVEITDPMEGDVVAGVVDIFGTVLEDTELSHYNVAIYPGDADFNDFSARLEDQTVFASEGFTNEMVYQWDTTAYEDGEYLIRLAARDAAGNRDLSGDPYMGGDDSQHVIRVNVVNSTKAEILMKSGVPGKGLEEAPGLQKRFNANSQAAFNAGKKR